MSPKLSVLRASAVIVVLSASATWAATIPFDAPANDRPAESGLRLAGKPTHSNPRIIGETPPPAAPDTSGTPGATSVPPAPATAPPVNAQLGSPARRTLADCMQLWDKDTHMSKAEWKDTCIRSQKEADKHEAAVTNERAKVRK